VIKMNECLFCKIVKGEIKSEKIYEDGDTLAFLDVNPSAPGHTIVIPKQHIQTILDLNEESLSRLFKTVKKVTEMIRNSLHPCGFNIGINQGECAGSRVPHLHIHIIPRYIGDGGAMIQMIVRNPPKEDLTTIANKIKSEEELPEYIREQIKEEGFEEREEKVDKAIGIIKETPKEEMASQVEPELEKKKEISEEKLEKLEEKEIKEKEKKYKGKKEKKDKEEELLEELEKIIKQMQIPH